MQSNYAAAAEDGEIKISTAETVALTSDQDPSLDPLGSGFEWWKAARDLSAEHHTSGHAWKISGHDMQILSLTVPAGEMVTTEVGSFVFMHPGMTTEVELTLCTKGGCKEGCDRICGGESCAKVFLKNDTSEEGYVGLTPNYPAKVVPVTFGVNVTSGGALIAQGGSYMTELGDVDVGCDLDCSFARCCLGGLGACRQKITGSDNSIVFLSAGGTIQYRTLNEDETIIVDTRSVLAYDDTVELGITPNGRFCTCCCGGEGCCSTTLTGPGEVYMQSMNFQKFRDAVQVTVNENEMDRGGGGASAVAGIAQAAM